MSFSQVSSFNPIKTGEWNSSNVHMLIMMQHLGRLGHSELEDWRSASRIDSRSWRRVDFADLGVYVVPTKIIYQ